MTYCSSSCYLLTETTVLYLLITYQQLANVPHKAAQRMLHIDEMTVIDNIKCSVL